MKQNLSVPVSDTFTLNAGWYEETEKETRDGEKLPCRLIHGPEITMYDQLLHYLEMISHDTRTPPKSQLHFSEVARATIAVCLRWGTYFAVLADWTKPLRPENANEAISMICNDEMARINIEASAALAQWLELMRTDDKHFRKMVKAAQQLPMFPSRFDAKTNNKMYRMMNFINSAQFRETFFTMLKEQHASEEFEQKRASVRPHSMRWLANGLINTYWRNESGIENIHAGRWAPHPLLQSRITPSQEYTLVKKMAEGFVPSMHAIYNAFNQKGDDDWEERVLFFGIRFSPPDSWSLTERTRDVFLKEPNQHYQKSNHG